MSPREATTARRLCWQAVIAVALQLWLAAAAAEVPARVADLAQQAKDDFAAALNPLPASITVFGLLRRELGSTARELARREHDEAVDALVLLAVSPDTAAEAEAALRQLARAGKSTQADALFASQVERLRGNAPASKLARTLRHGIALTELPAALWTQMNPLGAKPTDAAAGRAIRYGSTAGARAAPTLRELVALDPADPWLRLVLLWLGDDAAQASELAGAMSAIETSGDRRAAVAAAQYSAWAMSRRGYRQDAERLMLTAVARTRRAIDEKMQGFGEREAARAEVQLAALRRAIGDTEGTRSPLESALAIRGGLAAAAPDDIPAQLELATVHEALSSPPGAADKHLDALATILRQLQQRDRYTPIIGPSAWLDLITVPAAASAAIALFGAALMLPLYRRRIGHWMQRTARAQLPQAAAVTGDAVQISIRHQTVSPAVGVIGRDPRLAPALAQAASGLVFALTAVFVYATTAHLALKPVAWIVTLLIWLLPLVVVQWLVWAGSRRHQWLVLWAYAASLALLSLRVALSDTPPVIVGDWTIAPVLQPLLYLAVAVMPTVLLLLPLFLFLNRMVRAFGPAMLILALVMCAGGLLAYVMSSSPAGMDLTRSLPDSLVFHGSRLAFAIGATAFLPLALAALSLLSAAYRRGWLNDQSLVVDTVWLLSALNLTLSVLWEDGPAGLWQGLLPFAAYKVTAVGAGLAMRHAARLRRPRRLLLLRVFGNRSKADRRRSERLLDSLVSRWARLGPIQICAAPDLASSTIGPGKLLDFVSGRLGRRFVVEPADIKPRLAGINQRPDIEGRYRVNELFCGNDTWQATMVELMRSSDLVLMDLRGFNATRLGSRYELRALIDEVPADRIVLLVDPSTDRTLLAEEIGVNGRVLDSRSPNAAGTGVVTLLETDRDVATAIETVIDLSAEPPAVPRPASDVAAAATAAEAPRQATARR